MQYVQYVLLFLALGVTVCNFMELLKPLVVMRSCMHGEWVVLWAATTLIATKHGRHGTHGLSYMRKALE